MKIGGHYGCQMRISMFDPEPLIFDLEGKYSKFRHMRSLGMVPKNISMRFQHSPIKTVGRVPKKRVKSAKNGNDLVDLDFDLVTLKSIGDHELVHTYLCP